MTPRGSVRPGAAAALPLLLLVLGTAGFQQPEHQQQLQNCTFEGLCHWWWNTSQGFRVVTGQELNNSWVPSPIHRQPAGPFQDADNYTLGHFLYLVAKEPEWASLEVHVTSPKFVWTSGEQCKLALWLHMDNMEAASFKVVIETTNHTSWVVAERPGNSFNAWQNYTFLIGKVTQEFKIVLEVTLSHDYPAHLALDNILLKNCFPDPPQNVCSSTQFQCANSACIDATKVCDINIDCEGGEDESAAQECDKVMSFARCTFEDGWCGWHNDPKNYLNWTQNNGSTPTASTGPSFDHTYQNSTGMYLYVDMTGKQLDMGTASDLESPIIDCPPPYHSNVSSPYYNSCYITFHYHKHGPHSGSLGLFLIEMQRNTNVTTKVWWSFGTKGNKWFRQVVRLPNITAKYFLQFEARRSYAARGDPAIDDISMSPKCFGIGVPPEHLEGYVYGRGCGSTEPTPPPTVHTDFENATYYLFTTCGASGRMGPTQNNCTAAYSSTETNVTVLSNKLENGTQKWTVPESGYYTIIAKGASGGKGSDGVGTSWGAMSRTIVELTKGQNLYLLVGQMGNSACRKNFALNHRTVCKDPNSKQLNRPINKMTEISQLTFLPEGGGGGGATYVYTWPKNKVKKPLIIAAGGGGLGHGSSPVDTIHHGHGINKTLLPNTADAFGSVPAGAGGGWFGGNYSYRDTTGLALTQGGVGGRACYISSDGSHKGAGGFGGGGGGCTAGGGGGGYTGGRAWAQKTGLGEGGYSWIETGLMQDVWVSGRDGHGEVYIIPALANHACGCDFRCATLDTYRHATVCLCPDNWVLSNDSTTCTRVSTVPDSQLPTTVIYLIGLFAIGILLIVVMFLTTFLYNRYQRKKAARMRRKILSGPDLQLNRLREASDSMMTEYNPNYEFGGGTYSLRDLKDIPREHLRLVKALGQGAFGEVYQGFFKHRAGDAVEMPVAVKTLPELSTSQAETDFLMEALIMSKFNHPNIVHFIGVCFDKHPRFIVIELLAGGDLKTFLRESRPKPDRASPLMMKDLLSCIIDVAKGCKYMEENRFIHRDIAARNCLLTTKGPGRVVKIADFGMARDIYRADYYRKGGKAMLPIKWMPPEAFLDGIFTSKTDVWSFGVLMWEVMSLGYMPYTGCANREVMQLVTSGGRLEPPANCPTQLYAIMTQCWNPSPDKRPSFPLILERLGYCMQDPDVIKSALPVYTKPPSTERDTTIMRPTSGGGSNSTGGYSTGGILPLGSGGGTTDEECFLQPDYLVPLPHHLHNSVNPLPPLGGSNPPTSNVQHCWTTGLITGNSTGILPNSDSVKSNSQPLLSDSGPIGTSSPTKQPHQQQQPQTFVATNLTPPAIPSTTATMPDTPGATVTTGDVNSSLFIVSAHVKQDISQISC